MGKKKENKETVTGNLGKGPVTWETVIFAFLPRVGHDTLSIHSYYQRKGLSMYTTIYIGHDKGIGKGNGN